MPVGRTALSCMALLALSGGCDKVHKLAHGQKPNVILIYADDLGKGMLSAYGQSHLTTPHIDRLIRSGVSFSNAYGCMLSAPARASLLTGYHDCHTDRWRVTSGGRYVNAMNDTTLVAQVESQINAADITLAPGDLYLPQVFRQAGYKTAQVGKLEYGFTATRTQMRRHGWDYYYGYLDHVRCHGFYPPFLFDNGKIEFIDGNTRANCGKTKEPETAAAYQDRWNMEGKAVYSQDLFLEKMLQFIRDNKDQPFFLFHPTQLPHGPVSIPAIHPELEAQAGLTSIEKEYGSMVKMLDDHVGIIWDLLVELGIEQNTMIIFAADNGHEIYYGQQGRCEKPYRNMVKGTLFDDYQDKYYSTLSGDVFNGNAGMAGLKRSNLEGGAHIPLVFYWNGHLEAGAVRDQVVSMYDLIPTFSQWLGVSCTDAKDGTSFSKVLFDDKTLPEDRYVVFGSYIGPAIVTNDGWKLRYYTRASVYELYNLTEDPQETTNLIDRYPDKADALKTILLQECGGDLANGVCKI